MVDQHSRFNTGGKWLHPTDNTDNTAAGFISAELTKPQKREVQLVILRRAGKKITAVEAAKRLLMFPVRRSVRIASRPSSKSKHKYCKQL